MLVYALIVGALVALVVAWSLCVVAGRANGEEE